MQGIPIPSAQAGLLRLRRRLFGVDLLRAARDCRVRRTVLESRPPTPTSPDQIERGAADHFFLRDRELVLGPRSPVSGLMCSCRVPFLRVVAEQVRQNGKTDRERRGGSLMGRDGELVEFLGTDGSNHPSIIKVDRVEVCAEKFVELVPFFLDSDSVGQQHEHDRRRVL